VTSEVEKTWCLGYDKEDERERSQKMRRGKRCIEEKKGRAEEETKDIRGVSPGVAGKIFCFMEDIEIGFAHRFGTSIP
jgi:hypothetical protein